MTGAAHPVAEREPPHNFEAEQALLGAILIYNDAYHQVAGFLLPDHFADPAHARIYEACAKLIETGLTASPVTIKGYLAQGGVLDDVGGQKYLARLAGSATTTINAASYGVIVLEMFHRRAVMFACVEAATAAGELKLDDTVDGIIETLDRRLSEASVHGIDEAPLYLADAATVAIARADAAYKKERGISGLATGLTDLDGFTGGLQPGELIVLAGRTSMGKTDVATNIAGNAAMEKIPVLMASLEMDGSQIAARLLARQTGLSALDQRCGDLHANDFTRLMSAQRSFEEWPLLIDGLSNAPVAHIKSVARRMQRRRGLGLVVVDYLQLIRPAKVGRSDGRVQEVSGITRELKALAKTLAVPVLALSQLSRAVEGRSKKRPILSDLRESGSIEQDADIVIFAYRASYYHERDEPEPDAPEHAKWEEESARLDNRLELIVAKQRSGPTGTVRVFYDPAKSYVGNLERYQT